MADETVPLEDPDAPPSGRREPASACGRAGRMAAAWHRIRSGEDPLAFGAVVAGLAIAAGLFWFWAGAHHGVAAASPSPGPAAQPARHETVPGRADDAGPGPRQPPAGETVAIHVAGAVLRPGLYHLGGGARVADVIAAAGGCGPHADLERLNLAARVADGQRIFVPRRGEPVPADVNGGGGAALGGGATGPDAADGAGRAGPVDLNTADVAALDSLPGVGPATARAIIEERARRGGFRSTRDLLRIPGIGESRFARLKDLVRV